MEQGLAAMSAIETLRAYRTLQNADNVDDAINEITRAYEEIDRLRAQVADLEAGMMEYACTGTEHPCGCYTLLRKDRARVAELEKFIEGTAERNEELRAQVAEETRRAEDAHAMTLRQTLAIAELREALADFYPHVGCPQCSGDCGSANPPVIDCPMLKARAILAKTLPTDDWHDPFYVKLRRGK